MPDEDPGVDMAEALERAMENHTRLCAEGGHTITYGNMSIDEDQWVVDGGVRAARAIHVQRILQEHAQVPEEVQRLLSEELERNLLTRAEVQRAVPPLSYEAIV